MRIDRVFHNQLSHLACTVSILFRGVGKTKNARFWRFWSTTGADLRALFEEYATIQHYILGHEGNFLKSLSLARKYIGSEPGSASRAGLLLDILEANQLVLKGQIEKALRRYAQRILLEKLNYRMFLRQRRQAELGRVLSEQRQVLSLLELNIAQLLQRDSSGSGEAETKYQQACAYMPDSTYAHTCYADFLLSQKRWDQALEKFREAYAEKGMEDTETALNASLSFVYREWSRWLKSPEESANSNEGSETIKPYESSAVQALKRLDEALSTLKFKTVPDWEGALRFDRASILDEMSPEGTLDASDEFLKSADRYLNAGRKAGKEGRFEEKSSLIESIALAFERAGDVRVKLGKLEEAIAAYQNGLMQVEGIYPEKAENDWQAQRKRDLVDRLSSKLAITCLGFGKKFIAVQYLDRVWQHWWEGGRGNPRWGDEGSWGPYFDVQSLGKPILARTDLRHLLTIYFHGRLAKEPNHGSLHALRDARDLTAALLDLFRLVPKGVIGPTEETEVLEEAPYTADLLNVVTPIGVEISEELSGTLKNEDNSIKESPIFLVDDILDIQSLARKLKQTGRAKVAIRVDRFIAELLSAEARSALAHYESHISEPEQLQMALLNLFNRIVDDFTLAQARQFRDFIVQDIEEAARYSADHNEKTIIPTRLLRGETGQFLAKKPRGEDLKRLNAMLLEDAYPQELSRNAVNRYAVPMRMRIEEGTGVRVPGIRIRPSNQLKKNEYRFLIHEQYVTEGICNDQRLEPMFLQLETVISANLVEFFGHQETQNYLERNKLVIATVDDIAEKEHCSHIDPLTSVLRSLILERVPLTEPEAIYNTFHSGWQQGLGITTIVERVRRIPKVQARLWGNDENHEYLLLSSTVESLLSNAMRTAEQSNYLVMMKTDRDKILTAIGDAIVLKQRPVLIVRHQELRALVRQLIAFRFPDVPVLSTYEIRASAGNISEMPELNHQGSEP